MRITFIPSLCIADYESNSLILQDSPTSPVHAVMQMATVASGQLSSRRCLLYQKDWHQAPRMVGAALSGAKVDPREGRVGKVNQAGVATRVWVSGLGLRVDGNGGRSFCLTPLLPNPPTWGCLGLHHLTGACPSNPIVATGAFPRARGQMYPRRDLSQPCFLHWIQQWPFV